MAVAVQNIHGYVRKLSSRFNRLLQSTDDVFQVCADEWVDRLLAKPKYADPKKLNRFEYKVFSQMGEDGIIAEIFRRIGVTNKAFAEVGVGNGLENNTLYLIISGWTGVWIETCDENVRVIAQRLSRELKEGTLCLLPEFVTVENVESLFKKANLPSDLDLLSIDIDMNTYWVWDAIKSYHPRVIVAEYNAIFPPGCDWVVPYSSRSVWDGTSNFGASLTALELLGAEKGYRLVGCNLAGINAFFVRDDLAVDYFCEPFTAATHYEPARYYLTRVAAGHSRSVSHIWRRPLVARKSEGVT